MDNNQPSQNPNQSPLMTPSQPPVYPAQPPTPPPVQAPYPNAPKKSGNKLWLWITLGVVGLLTVISSIILVLTLPAITARAIATSYMDAIRDKDEAKIKSLDGEGMTPFTKHVSDGLQGATYEVTSTASTKEGYRVNFDVSGSKTITDTSVFLDNGKVAKLNLNAKSKATPDESKGSGSKSNDASTTVTTSTCLTSSGLASAGILGIDQKSLDNNAHDNNGYSIESVYFKPDSIDFEYPSVENENLDKLANVYTLNKNKRFNYVLIGSVRESNSSSAGVTLANQRATVIKDGLVARGVPSDMITIAQPMNNSSPDYDGTIFRSVDVRISLSNCNQASSNR